LLESLVRQMTSLKIGLCADGLLLGRHQEFSPGFADALRASPSIARF